jgi:outer membrane lipoprotein-sorting protein
MTVSSANGSDVMRARIWAVGAAAAALFGVAAAQQPKTQPVKPASATTKPEPAKSADALATMLGEARAAYAKTRDYSGTFTRQERVGGKLSAEQVGEIKARVSPFGMYVRFVRPDNFAGAEVAYSAAKKDGKVRYRLAGVAGRKGFQVLGPEDAKFLADHRHPVTDWGIGPIIELIATSTAREKTLNNPVEVYTADYRFANRNVTRYEILTRRPHAFRYAAKMVVYVDKETKLPVRFEAYDEPKPGTTAGELIEAYSFTDLKFNSGLGENTFEY